MLKKIVTLFFVLLFISLFPAGAFAADDGIAFGIKFSQVTVGATEDVLGGSYLYLGPLISFNETFSINLKYFVNLAPESFTDQLIMINPQFNFIQKAQGMASGGFEYYLGICYLKSRANEYYGLTYSPLCLGRSSTNSFRGALVDLIPITYLYSPQTGEQIIMFELMGVGGLF